MPSAPASKAISGVGGKPDRGRQEESRGTIFGFYRSSFETVGACYRKAIIHFEGSGSVGRSCSCEPGNKDRCVTLRSNPVFQREVPAVPDWFHEIKHNGYRLIVLRQGNRVRLFTRNGHDWSGRFPLITEAALRNRSSSFVLDGEAVLLGVDGISDFNGLHSRKHDDEVMLYAFDILVSDGEDIRRLPLHLRKNNLARLWPGASTASFCLTSNRAR
jgi:hypothetical protein